MEPSGSHISGSDPAHLAIRKMMEVSSGPKDSDQRASKRAAGSGSAPTSALAEQVEDKPTKTIQHWFVLSLDRYGRVMSWLRQRRRWVLLALLVVFALVRPGLVFGSLVVSVILLASMRIAMGAEVFWRRVLAFYAVVETHRPGLARKIKLRAFVLSKKWQRLLDRLPEAVSDPFRPPDLVAIMAADARYDEVLAARLNQLRQDEVR